MNQPFTLDDIPNWVAYLFLIAIGCLLVGFISDIVLTGIRNTLWRWRNKDRQKRRPF